MLVTSWAFTVLRRCSSAEGLQAPGHFEDFAPRERLQVGVVQLAERPQRVGRIVNQCPNQCLFRLFQLSERRQLAGRQRGPAIDGSLTDFRSDDVFCNARLVGDPIGELVTRRGVREPRGNRQHSAEKLASAVVVAEIEPRRRLIEQVL